MKKIVGVMDFNSDTNRLGIPGVLPEYRKRGIGYIIVGVATIIYGIFAKPVKRKVRKEEEED